MADLKVGIEIGAKNAFSPEARKMGAAADALSQRLSASQKRLGELAARDDKIKRLGGLGKNARQVSAEFTAAKKKTEALKREFKAAESPSKKLDKALQSSKRETAELGRAQARQREELRELRREMRESGIEAGNLGRAQRSTADDFERASGQIRQATGREPPTRPGTRNRRGWPGACWARARPGNSAAACASSACGLSNRRARWRSSAGGSRRSGWTRGRST